jgi:hypothetical protein
MSLDIIISEKEIRSLPNDQELGRYIRKKFYGIKEDLERSMDVEYDHCSICGKLSPYTKMTNIEGRIGYDWYGSGQGCFTPNECDKI